MLTGHVDSRGSRFHQKIPFPFDLIGSRFEHNLMGILGKMTDAEWLYRNEFTKRAVNGLARKIVIPMIHGEVLTPGEIENMVRKLEAEGLAMALGICECRHGEKRIEAELVDGVDPNYTCVMIGNWGRGHLYTYPNYYRRVTADELVELARFWHRRDRILSAWGCDTIHGFVASYCHCQPEYCVPLRNQLKRGNKVFIEGYSYAVVDPDSCIGPADCEWNCVSHCPFDAIDVRQGKASVDPERCYGCGLCFEYCPTGASSRVRRKNHRLYYCPPDMVCD